ncbi:MAG: hypothetical protein H6767_06950 [Candidatus Peribacteria bacterium]|nr:MAG: hypothetical protein H6767_06950 [Candidatus Peribacteria bacterium]
MQIDSDKTAKQNVEATFVTLIEKLIYAFGALAILIMTIGGGYMIMYNGQDELLSKGKSIFMAGIISVFVALGAGIIINLIRFILYA